MNRASILIAPALIFIAVCVGGLRAQSPQTALPAEQVFKNIQVLKGTPADQIIPAMQFVTSSLGVRCEHCHVEGAFDKDDKKPKKTAREMMQMMFALNQNSFKGEREVTCYSCHRGALRPVSTPVIDAANAPPSKPVAETQPAPSQSADDILNKYLQAVGGSTAIDKISSEVQKGKLKLPQGVQFPVEIYLKQPGMRSVVTHLPSGVGFETVNGQSGWTLVPGRPLRNMSKGDLQAAGIDADLHLPAHIKTSFSDLKVRPDEQIAGRTVNVIRARNPNSPPVELYFDQQSGLLVRMVRYVDSPLGRNPSQIDYSDYRDVAGIKQPFQWTVAQPQGRFTIQLEDIAVNVAVADANFARPEASSSANGH
jgi:photosynthetic reaction center cytochrome c subunit